MLSLPQLVRRRLQWQVDMGPHPDPDLLTAFVESCLSADERARVLQHMAACEDCRQVVFLSLPAAEEEQQLISKSRVGWMQWRALRWGAVAACALVVGAAVTLHREPHSEFMAPTIGVKSDRDVVPSKPSIADSNSSDVVVLNDGKAETEKTSENFAKSRASNPHFAMRLDSHSGTRLPFSPAQSTKIANAPARETSNSSASSTLDRLQQPRRDEDRRVEKREELPSVLAKNVPSAQPASKAELATGKAKEPLTKNEATAEAKKSELRDEQGAAAAGGLVLAPRWTLLADGTLQRSFNAGTTWETIPVAPDAKLRALAAIGTEIWVGGSAGELYHSADAGNSWTHVKPTAAGRSLSSDIIGVEFTDTQHGKLTLADGAVWTTVDGGQSWNTE